MGFLAAGHANSDNGAADVSGQTYAAAVKVLKSQGYKAVFGGSVGSDVPQAQCIVESQKFLPNARVSLMLNCTRAAQPAAVRSRSQRARRRLQRHHHREGDPGGSTADRARSGACAADAGGLITAQLGGVHATGSCLIP